MNHNFSFTYIVASIVFLGSFFVSYVGFSSVAYAQECTGQFGSTYTYDVGTYSACPTGSCGSMWCKTGTMTCMTLGAGGYGSNGVCQTYTDCGFSGGSYSGSSGSCDTSTCVACSGSTGGGGGGYCGDTQCNNGETSSSCPADCPSTNFNVSLSQTTQSIYENGGYAYYQVVVAPYPWQSGQSYTLSFTSCPAGVTCAFADGSNVTSSTYSEVSTSWDGTETTIYNNAYKQIKLTSTRGTPPGTYSFSIRATKNGVSKDVTGWAVIIAPNSSCSSISVPSSLSLGQSFNATVTMYNSGSMTWTNGAYGAARDGVFTYPRPGAAATWGSGSGQFIPQTNYYDTTSVAPGYSYTFTIPSIAPTIAGSYNYSTQMYHGGTTQSDTYFFGAVCNAGLIKVDAPPPTASAPVVYLNVNPSTANDPGNTTVSWTGTNNPTSCTATGGYGTTWAGAKASSGTQDLTWYPEGNYTITLSCTNAYGTGASSKTFTVTNTGTNNSSCTSIIAPTSVTKGQTFTAYVTMKNTGTKTWNNVYTSSTDQAHKLGSSNPIDNLKWGASSQRTLLPAGTTSVPPGQSVVFTLNSLTAPTTVGTYSLDFKMVEEAVQWFGEQCSTNVSVVDPPTQYNLVVAKTIGGTITTTDGQISCGTTCTKQYVKGSSVTLQPIPDTFYWKFVGWGGACAGQGTGNCVLTVNGDTAVTAQFRPKSLLYKEF